MNSMFSADITTPTISVMCFLFHSCSSLQLEPPNTPRQGRMKGRIPNNQPARVDGIVMEGSVLAVKAGNQPVSNLTQPINLIFNYNHKVNAKTNCAPITLENKGFPLIVICLFQVENGTCVFWHEPQEGNGTGGLHMLTSSSGFLTDIFKKQHVLPLCVFFRLLEYGGL